MSTSTPKPKAAESKDFIRTMVEQDLQSGKFGGRVVTRFPPEPNGYPHIGHAKSISINFGLAQEYGGTCHLRFDDTNPETEDMEYVEAMQRDIKWLGFDWGDKLFFASDYFDRYYELAEQLIRDGKAYVDSLQEDEIREYRGTVTEPGRNSPYRDRSPEENLGLFRRMKAGEFPDGAHVLRAKIDMAAANMKMRDPLLYRIRHASHYRTGDTWCIYPMYDFAHPLGDAIEHITHSLCTLEFENNRAIYDWLVDNAAVEAKPEQTEFARLNFNYTVMSKRKLLQLVKHGVVAGWDDPRMPTLAGLRRRGYTPRAVRNLCETVGVAKANSVVDVAQLEHAIRDDLNFEAPRVMAVLRPLKVVLTNYPEGQEEELEAAYYPHDVPKEGSRQVPFSRELYIERDDFHEDPPKKFFRLAPGREVRLRYAYFIRCEEVIKDDVGEIVELRCTYDPATRGGDAPDGRKVKGTLHWVSARHALPAEVRLYDRLFQVERPDLSDEDILDLVNPDSLQVLDGARVESSLATAVPGEAFQFERQGYFAVDPDSSFEVDEAARSGNDGTLVFNRTVTLRDTWAKVSGQAVPESEAKKAAAKQEKAQQKEVARQKSGAPKPSEKKDEKPLTPEQEARLGHYRDEVGLSDADARLLTLDAKLAAFFDTAAEAHPKNPQGVANWVLNDLQRERKDRPLAELPFGPTELAELVALIDDGTLSTKLAKDVFGELLESGGRPKAIVKARGLAQVSDRGALQTVVDEVVAAHPAQAGEYRGGKEALLGFFVGKVMQATRGQANPQLTQELLRAALAG